MLTPLFLVLSTAVWAQESESTDEPTEADAPTAEEPAPPVAPEPPPEPGAQHEPGTRPPPVPPRGAFMSDRHKKASRRCESWEIAVWHPKKSGCANYPDATGDEWCAVPDGMVPIQPVGDTAKWWVKRCADVPPEPK